MAKLYLVRTKKGKLLGPLDEKQVCHRIDEGEFEGEEELSSYPSGKWKPLSSHPVFYNKILSQMKDSIKDKEELSSLSTKESLSDQSSLEESQSVTEQEEVTRIIEPKKLEKELKASKKEESKN